MYLSKSHFRYTSGDHSDSEQCGLRVSIKVSDNVCKVLYQMDFITNTRAISALITANSVPKPMGLASGWSSI